ncbi:hypothetical protein APA_3766 [Pseudanabaena sp. lw0831]|nr:hypothetical protein APA_3766 [Pseudanabaena sp. lw0831]
MLHYKDLPVNPKYERRRLAPPLIFWALQCRDCFEKLAK